ncbi:MAG TPA: gamma-glutamyl-gamma-aminobutyrate hydrolase family protein [Thermomicrobiales bacterium]|nr:gamma-glutamyl-gamma-aminobutyrate hydrolase family protein [Thermomicrobiales bacterium]
MKPVIGISPSPSESTFDHGHFRRYALGDTYTRAIIAAGGVPVILPLHTGAIDETLDAVDGIVFSGGGDIDPGYWNEEKHPAADGFDDERDAFELQAIPKVVERDIPMLGICRGIQTVNVALGGTLIQDIPDQLPGAQQHRQHREGKMRDARSHTITITEGDNLLYRIHGDTKMQTNSFHHQAVKDPAEELEVVAITPDGVVEAMWHPRMTFGLAVQWHPEMLAEEYPDQAAIFEALVRAAADKKAGK